MEKTILATAIVTLLAISQISAGFNRYVVLTFDVERDLPPLLNSTAGLQSFSSVVSYLKNENVKATFFFTSNAAQKYPELLHSIISQVNEVGGHSVFHDNLSAMNFSQVINDVASNFATLSYYGANVSAFRAPYNEPGPYLDKALNDLGFRVDASFNGSYPHFSGNLLILSSSPIFYPSSVYPDNWVNFIIRSFKAQNNRTRKIVVVGAHPWEFIKMPDIQGMQDYTRPAGNYTWNNLKNLVEYSKITGVNFITASQAYSLFSNN